MRIRIAVWRHASLVLLVVLSSGLLARPTPRSGPYGRGTHRPALQAPTRPTVLTGIIAQRALARYGHLPLRFEPNQGQTDRRVPFLVRGAGYTIFLARDEIVLALADPRSQREPSGEPGPMRPHDGLGMTRCPAVARLRRVRRATRPRMSRGTSALPTAGSFTCSLPPMPFGTPLHRAGAARVMIQGSVVRLRFEEANLRARWAGEDRLPGVTNYLTGQDPRGWRRQIPGYARVVVHDLYPGIDLVFHGEQGRLEYDLVVKPAADPRRIRLAVEGSTAPLRLEGDGALLLSLATGVVRQDRPAIYQGAGRVRRSVLGRYVLAGRSFHAPAGTVGFAVGNYDRRRPLVIDPVLVYSTYLGGSGGGESGTAIAVDGSSHMYVTGTTLAADFPTTTNAYSRTQGNIFGNAFVTELSTDGSGLIYSTYLGGSGNSATYRGDGGTSIALRPGCVSVCHAYVTGFTNSADFPTTTNAVSRTLGSSGVDGFVAELSGDGRNLVYGTYLGGSGNGNPYGVYGGIDQGSGIAVDAGGRVYVTGTTYSTDFPTTTNALSSTLNGASAAFMAEIDPTGSGAASLLYSTYLGSGSDGHGIAVDATGHVYVTGHTEPYNFPTTAGAFSPTISITSSPAFVVKLDTTMTGTASLVYGTYLGGSGDSYAGELGAGIVVDGAGDAYVTGYTTSHNFPTTTGAYSRTLTARYGGNAFMAELSADGSSLVYSTYFGGNGGNINNGIDRGAGIALRSDCTSACHVYVTGTAYSSDMPTTPNAVSRTQPGLRGAGFVAAFDPAASGASSLLYGTYLGGSGERPYLYTDGGAGIAVDAAGHAYVIGTTYSRDFPTTTNAVSRTLRSAHGNAFVSELDTAPGGSGTLLYSTYLGGSGVGDSPRAIAVDALGHAYVTGSTTSADFPTTTGAYSRTLAGVFGNAFITELSSDGTSLVYSTYLGGSGNGASNVYANSQGDIATGIALQPGCVSACNAYVTGSTTSADFPTTTGAYSRTLADPGGNVFVSELSGDGSSLLYGTYLGGSGHRSPVGSTGLFSYSGDNSAGIAVDALGHAYVTGSTTSADFPTTTGAYSRTAPTVDGFAPSAFVTALDPMASGRASLLYSTYLGGHGWTSGNGIAVDATGHAYVTGFTASPDFPTTTNAFSRTVASHGSAFATELSPDGTSLVYSTVFGGSQGYGDLAHTAGSGIAVDSAGHAFVTGYTISPDFPTTPNAFSRQLTGGQEAFATELDTGGCRLVYSTFLGGSGASSASGIATDGLGHAYVVGNAHTGFPTTVGAISSTPPGLYNGAGFVAEIDTALSGTESLIYGTYLGGSGIHIYINSLPFSSVDQAFGIAVGSPGHAYVTGSTGSIDFPTTSSAYERALRSPYGNGYVAALTISQPVETPVVPSGPCPTAASQATSTATTMPAPATATATATTMPALATATATATTAAPTATPTPVVPMATSTRLATLPTATPTPLARTSTASPAAIAVHATLVAPTATGTPPHVGESMPPPPARSTMEPARSRAQRPALVPPVITLRPGAARAGTRISVVGAHFAPAEQVTLALDGEALDTLPTLITTGGDGTFTATIVAPESLVQGANTLSAIGTRSRWPALATLHGLLPVATRFYLAGALQTRGEHATLALLNPTRQSAHVRLTFYFTDGGIAHAALVTGPTRLQLVPLASLAHRVGPFGLALTADQPLAATVQLRRDGRDGDSILPNTGLGTRWYLAEGYTNLTFRETVAILNPDPRRAAHVHLHLLPIGSRVGRTVEVRVPAHSEQVVDVNHLLPRQALSLVATADRGVVVERTLEFSNRGYGLTTRVGTSVAAQSWLFADGATTGGVQTFLTILNPGGRTARVTARFYGGSGQMLGQRALVVARGSRATIKLNEVVRARDVASLLTSDAPVVVERPEYAGSPNERRVAGSDVFGRNGTGVLWRFAGGALRGEQANLVLYNPSSVPVPVAVTFYDSDGRTLSRRVVLAPSARDALDPGALVHGATVLPGVVVGALSGPGLVAEQTVSMPGHGLLSSTQGLAQ